MSFKVTVEYGKGSGDSFVSEFSRTSYVLDLVSAADPSSSPKMWVEHAARKALWMITQDINASIGKGDRLPLKTL